MNRLIAASLFSVFAGFSFAGDVDLDGTVGIQLAPRDRVAFQEKLEFELPQFKLSARALDRLKTQLEHYQRHGSDLGQQPLELPRHVNLEMQGTPVLNQGKHGSCVTFAVTAALDALLGAGDYISQLCNLELGSQLAVDGMQPYSGWSGNYGALVLEQIDKYGMISINYQKSHGCAGVKEYPLTDKLDEGNLMSVAEFKAHSIPINKLYSWSVLMFNEGWLLPEHDMNAMLTQVKQELAKGNRLTFGVLLDVQLGKAGAMGTHNITNDTWMITPQILADGMNGKVTAGHDMVIMGYDDNAVVVDKDGNSNQGIFILRNSWSTAVGDNGNYYVSYDYFKYFTQEIHLYQLN